METSKKLSFLNPVLNVPWQAQTKHCENPNIFHSLKRDLEKDKIAESLAKIRKANIESLMTRFPGLKKYQARAALTMSANKLEKAIILLEVSNCYRKETLRRNLSSVYLKNIYINLCYDYEEQDPSLRNVVFESSFSSPKRSDARNELRAQRNSLSDTNSDSENSSDRVGVVIRKTMDGYKATPFSEIYSNTK